MDTKEHKITWQTNYWWGCIVVKSQYIKEIREVLDKGIKKYKSKYFENDMYEKDILKIYKRKEET